MKRILFSMVLMMSAIPAQAESSYSERVSFAAYLQRKAADRGSDQQITAEGADARVLLFKSKDCSPDAVKELTSGRAGEILRGRGFKKVVCEASFSTDL